MLGMYWGGCLESVASSHEGGEVGYVVYNIGSPSIGVAFGE